MALSADEIHKMAKDRVGFKQHLGVYVIVNLMLAGIWFVTSDERTLASYWPIWAHLGWGVGLAFNAFGAYGPRRESIAKEEEKIRQKMG